MPWLTKLLMRSIRKKNLLFNSNKGHQIKLMFFYSTKNGFNLARTINFWFQGKVVSILLGYYAITGGSGKMDLSFFVVFYCFLIIICLSLLASSQIMIKPTLIFLALGVCLNT